MAVADLVYAGVLLFAVIIGFSLIYGIGFTVTDQLEDELDLTNPQINQTVENIYETLDTLDITFIFLFFGIFTAIILIAWAVPVSPIAYGVILVSLVIFLLVTPVLTNTYMSFAEDFSLINVEERFPYSFHVMTNYPMYITIFSFILLIVLVARWRLTSA